MAENPAQFEASDPAHSVWLSAHAGTGKTKVLVDRVLRLLLGGAKPASIICITYTKAAATEMQLRIRKVLSEWMVQSDDELHKELDALLGRSPNDDEIQKARSLLCLLMEDEYGVNVQTIHSFCQSLLSRFPLESGVSPHFQLLDDRTARELLAEAKQRLFAGALNEAHDPLAVQALRDIAGQSSDYALGELIEALIKSYRSLEQILRAPCGVIRLNTMIYTGLGVEYGMTKSDILSAVMIAPDETLSSLIDQLHGFGKKELAMADAIKEWQSSERNVEAFSALAGSMLTSKGEARKAGKVCQEDVSAHTALLFFQNQIIETKGLLDALTIARYSEAAMVIAESLLTIYQRLKVEQAYLDYDDLIWHAVNLLEKSGMCAWVISKLDYQIDHLLIDEAQDTNPLQWKLTKILTSELFTPDVYEDSPRSLFVVGDDKQSIYSFQGANLDLFHAMGVYYEDWYERTAQKMVRLTLDTSYRSSAAVLSVVDQLFALPEARDGVMIEGELQHQVHRTGHAGRVELWPFVETEKTEPILPWEQDAPDYEVQNTHQQLAEQITAQIVGWIEQGRELPPKARPVQAGDIMVLVRRRNELVSLLASQLKKAGIAVAGADRLKLTTHLAIQDVLALAELCLHPFDDVNLAGVLKSPWFGWSEDQLYEAAYGRADVALIDRLDETAQSAINDIIEQSKILSVHGWLIYVLERLDGRKASKQRFGMEVDELFDELLAQSLLYESGHITSLQGFVHWLRVSDEEVKREMASAGNAVRIMTVHGAKGLQAPIVILPDTTATPQSSATLWWDEVYEQSVCYVAPAGVKTPALEELKANKKQAELREYRRLLYVAMTRAEDELYVTGAMPGNRKLLPSDCWYELVRKTLSSMNCQESDGLLSINCPQTESVKAKEQGEEDRGVALPDWINQPAPKPLAVQVITPSASTGGESFNVVVQANEHAQKAKARGNLTHALLQWLPAPDVVVTQQQLMKMAEKLVPPFMQLPLDEIVQEVLAICSDKSLRQFLFSEHSRAEVSLCGHIDDIPVQGQIDRLIFAGDVIHVVDYKTNANPPECAEDVSLAYKRQLYIYRALLDSLYPNHTLRCYLLWTRNANLMELPEQMLVDAAPASLDSDAA